MSLEEFMNTIKNGGFWLFIATACVGLVMEIFKLLLSNIFTDHRHRKVRKIIVVTSLILAAGSFIGFVFSGERVKTEAIAEQPLTVVGIYPSDLFGIDQMRGLEAAFRGNGYGIELIHINFLTAKQMKGGGIDSLKDSLSTVLESRNVAAIVGPPISECINDVLELLFQEESKVPIFITTAASQSDLKWDQYSRRLNLFRTATGTDSRAQAISDVISTETGIKESLVLVEHNDRYTTFGQKYLNELRRDPLIKHAVRTGEVEIVNYSNDTSQLNDLDFLALVRSRLNSKGNLFVIGVDGKFPLIIDSFYRGQIEPDSLPMLGGWMNGYVFNKEILLGRSNVVSGRVFEITDIDLPRVNGISADISKFPHIGTFKTEFGPETHPGQRDIALTFDVGICILDALERIDQEIDFEKGKVLKLNKSGCDLLVKKLKSQTVGGVMSNISFDDRGVNLSWELKGAVFNSETAKWEHREFIDIFK